MYAAGPLRALCAWLGRCRNVSMTMKIYLPILALFSLAASANDYIGVPIGHSIEYAPGEAETTAAKPLIIEGPFEGLFSMFDRYQAHVSVSSGLLFMAEAQKAYSSFETCSNDTIQAWNKLKQAFGKPVVDEDQVWWFTIGNQQQISVNCKIYGASGKIALNATVVDTALARATMKEKRE